MVRNVVIAVDGTDAARSALGWAVDLIARQQTDEEHPIRAAMINVWHPTECIGIDGFGLMADGDYPERSEKLLDELTGDVVAEIPSASDIEHVVRQGFTAKAILAEAAERDADMIVVGTRAEGPIRQSLVGSVSQWLASVGERVVAVIPAGASPMGESTLVGFDESPGSAAALEWAVANCSGTVHAVTVLEPPLGEDFERRAGDDQRRRAVELLGEPLPDNVELSIETGNTIEVLTKLSADTNQAVLGSRSDDDAASIWGSVTTRFVSVAPEPVIVVPPPD